MVGGKVYIPARAFKRRAQSWNGAEGRSEVVYACCENL